MRWNADADLAFELWKDPNLARYSAVGQARQSFDMGDELAAVQRLVGMATLTFTPNS